jgi:hypothetical protein
VSAAVDDDRCEDCGYLMSSVGHRRKCVPPVPAATVPVVPRVTVPHRVLCRHCLAGQLVRNGRVRDHVVAGERFVLCDGSGEPVP